ncbi:hypothetical protein AXE65_10680 [Ventosimonas gracilis]|uniref:Uncharacterized protein n=1 Tax=Ventosimonas gracilis TaxID=1680762 RepID=A0A139SWQ3_9GAMM|nr:hypothetical protein AXE65_10680 [Ventosimonas gracilis]
MGRASLGHMRSLLVEPYKVVEQFVVKGVDIIEEQVFDSVTLGFDAHDTDSLQVECKMCLAVCSDKA